MTQTGRGFDDVLADWHMIKSCIYQSFDIDGVDVTNMLSILSAMAFAEKIDFFELCKSPAFVRLQIQTSPMQVNMGYVYNHSLFMIVQATVQDCLDEPKPANWHKSAGRCHAVEFTADVHATTEMLCWGPWWGHYK